MPATCSFASPKLGSQREDAGQSVVSSVRGANAPKSQHVSRHQPDAVARVAGTSRPKVVDTWPPVWPAITMRQADGRACYQLSSLLAGLDEWEGGPVDQMDDDWKNALQFAKNHICGP